MVALSGGVDSSVSLWLLKQEGYYVEGLFMKSWEEDDKNCCTSAKDLADVESVCNKLKVNLHKINFSDEYWNKVFKNFIYEYKQGYTPNPDILCNKEIKFKCFLKLAIKTLNANYIATGHYVRKLNINGRYQLLKGIDSSKDQSYFLYTLSYKQISYCLFPLGSKYKKEVRKIASNLGLITANKKDSSGICFIGNRKFRTFIKKYLPEKPGEIVLVNGEKIGKHTGSMYYTLGQRRGLGIGGLQGSCNGAWYVISKDCKNNKLIVSKDKYHLKNMSKEFIINRVHWVSRKLFKVNSSLNCTVKTRYRQPDHKCCIFFERNCIRIILDTPLNAITIGQSAVFYLSEICLGGGIINTVINLE